MKRSFTLFLPVSPFSEPRKSKGDSSSTCLLYTSPHGLRLMFGGNRIYGRGSLQAFLYSCQQLSLIHIFFACSFSPSVAALSSLMALSFGTLRLSFLPKNSFPPYRHHSQCSNCLSCGKEFLGRKDKRRKMCIRDRITTVLWEAWTSFIRKAARQINICKTTEKCWSLSLIHICEGQPEVLRAGLPGAGPCGADNFVRRIAESHQPQRVREGRGRAERHLLYCLLYTSSL